MNSECSTIAVSFVNILHEKPRTPADANRLQVRWCSRFIGKFLITKILDMYPDPLQMPPNGRLLAHVKTCIDRRPSRKKSSACL